MITSTPAFTLTVVITDEDNQPVREADVLDLAHADDIIGNFCRDIDGWRTAGVYDHTEGDIFESAPEGSYASHRWSVRPIVRHDIERVAGDLDEGVLSTATTAMAYARATGSRGSGYSAGDGTHARVERLGTRASTGQGIWRVTDASDPAAVGIVFVNDAPVGRCDPAHAQRSLGSVETFGWSPARDIMAPNFGELRGGR